MDLTHISIISTESGTGEIRKLTAKLEVVNAETIAPLVAEFASDYRDFHTMTIPSQNVVTFMFRATAPYFGEMLFHGTAYC